MHWNCVGTFITLDYNDDDYNQLIVITNKSETQFWSKGSTDILGMILLTAKFLLTEDVKKSVHFRFIFTLCKQSRNQFKTEPIVVLRQFSIMITSVFAAATTTTTATKAKVSYNQLRLIGGDEDGEEEELN